MKRMVSYAVFFTMLVLISACAKDEIPPVPTPTPAAEIANPASVFCEQNSGQLELRTDASGSVAGFCLFADGSECEEWGYFRGDCHPGNSLQPSAVPSTETLQSPTLDARGGYMDPGTSEEISDWWGVIKATEQGAQYDDYFELRIWRVRLFTLVLIRRTRPYNHKSFHSATAAPSSIFTANCSAMCLILTVHKFW
jgi:putative hemolysin